MNYNVGDKLYCKETIIYNSNKFVKGCFYNIENKESSVGCIFYHISYNTFGSSFGSWFYINKKDFEYWQVGVKTRYYYIWDYFYTTQELRKLKLEKINDYEI